MSESNTMTDSSAVNAIDTPSTSRIRVLRMSWRASVIGLATLLLVVREVLQGGKVLKSFSFPTTIPGILPLQLNEEQYMTQINRTLEFMTPGNSNSSTPKESEQQELKRSSKHKPLNIIILYGDDWRHDSIGSANASIVRTPFLDWLAQQGVKFVHNCVTTSVCWVSRATLYTGLYISRHGSDRPRNPQFYQGWNDTWPKILRDHGYFLGHVGKWHFPTIDAVSNTFHYWKSYYGQHWYEQSGERIHTTKLDERNALSFLQSRPKDKPFILEVCFFAPHSVDGTTEQYFPQNESMSLYENETVAVPISATAEAWNQLPWFFGDSNEARKRWMIRFDSPEKHQQMMKNYFRLISEIDKTSDAIYRELKAQNILNDTMIIFTTDNGLFHSEHQLAGKWYPHQESIRVPLIIKDPRMPEARMGTINYDFTLNIDLATTILGAAGVKPPSAMQGRDIADLYLPPLSSHYSSDDVSLMMEPWRNEFYYEHPIHLSKAIIPASTALVRKKYKFITWPDYQVEQFFDLDADPLELQDLINSSKVQDLVSEMRIQHSLFQRAARKPGPIDQTIAAERVAQESGTSSRT